MLRSYTTLRNRQKSGKVAKNINLLKLFGVEGMVTQKTIVTESAEDIRKKSAADAEKDMRFLLDELRIKVCSEDIIGICEVLTAMRLRVDYMQEIIDELRKMMK